MWEVVRGRKGLADVQGVVPVGWKDEVVNEKADERSRLPRHSRQRDGRGSEGRRNAGVVRDLVDGALGGEEGPGDATADPEAAENTPLPSRPPAPPPSYPLPVRRSTSRLLT